MTIIADHPRPERAGILHLGLGSFHRAHQAVYTAAALQADEKSRLLEAQATQS